MDFTEKNGNLIITVDAEERETLREWKDSLKHSYNSEVYPAFDSDETRCDFFEDFIANSEWEWIAPEENGDLTDAPILGDIGEPDRRYGFMDYQIDSVLGRLLETGECIFQGAS